MTPGIVVSVEQGTPEWRQARCGNVTASRCYEMNALTADKKQYTAKRANYRAELICEILTRQPYPKYVTQEMQWGIEHEADARVAYELREGVLVDTVGFIRHAEVDRFGCSPDGLILSPDGDLENFGMVQIKCPMTSTHLAWLKAGTVPLEHLPQMVAEISCAGPGAAWSDFVSFDPRLPEHLQLFVAPRYMRDNRVIGTMERQVQGFNDEIDAEIGELPAAPQKIAEVLDWPCADEVEF